MSKGPVLCIGEISLQFSNKTAEDIDINLQDTLKGRLISSMNISFLRGDHLFTYGPANTTAGKNRFKISNNTEYFNEGLDTLVPGKLHDQFISVSDSSMVIGESHVLPSHSIGVLEIKLDTITNTQNYFVDELDVNVYPNPAQTYLNVDIVTTSLQHLTIELVDSYGRNCFKQEIHIYPGMKGINLETNHISNGLYFLLMKGEKGFVYSEKIMVCK